MNKQYISYGIIGVLAGLILGFFVGNAGTAGGQRGETAASNQTSQSVNSGGPGQPLPPNHPEIKPGEVVPAGPLTQEQMKAGAPAGATAPAGETPSAAGEASLPLLDVVKPGSTEKRVEQERKNIQVLKGLPADRLMPVMKAFAAALGVTCTYCHVSVEQPEKDDKPTKSRAREMIKMMRTINASLGGGQKVSCVTCHRGNTRPNEQ